MDIQKQQLTIEGAVTYSRLFDALKGMYEVDDDDSVWEIFNQADDQIEEVVNALKLLSAPPAPVKLPDELTTDGIISMHECGVVEGWNACIAEALRLNGTLTNEDTIDNTAQQYEALAGWKMVPIEPTAAMYDAGDKQLATKQVWDAMLAAAPKPEGQ